MSTLSNSSTSTGVPAESSWQAVLRQRIEDQQRKDKVYEDIIDQYRNLALTLRDTTERTRTFLRAVPLDGGGGGVSSAGGKGEVVVVGGGRVVNDSATHTYIATLEKQLHSLRRDLSVVYRSQATNQNKILSLVDSLREKDDHVRRLEEESRALREETAKGARKEKEWEERWKMREVDVQVSVLGRAMNAPAKNEPRQTLHDEVMSLNLELNQLTQRNANLQADNASLLQRWLDRMNEKAERMNEDFEREATTTTTTTSARASVDTSRAELFDPKTEGGKADEKAGTSSSSSKRTLKGKASV